MSSSIFPFSERIPKVLAAVLAAMLGSLLLSGIFVFYLNPEIRFYQTAYQVKKTYANKLDHEYKFKFIFAGGSSCAFQIDTGILVRKYGVPGVNMGMHAGMGGDTLLGLAMAAAKPGDTLIVALEPTALESPAPTQLGYQTLLAISDKKVRDQLLTLGVNFDFFKACNVLRPGLKTLITWSSSLALRRPSYRYNKEDLARDGYMFSPMRNSLTGSIPVPYHLSAESKAALSRLTQWAQSQNIRLAYLLPWDFYKSGDAAQAMAYNRVYLKEIAAFMPILQDKQFGVWTWQEDFADTNYHLTHAAAEVRTDQLAPICTQWQVWSVNDL